MLSWNQSVSPIPSRRTVFQSPSCPDDGSTCRLPVTRTSRCPLDRSSAGGQFRRRLVVAVRSDVGRVCRRRSAGSTRRTTARRGTDIDGLSSHPPPPPRLPETRTPAAMTSRHRRHRLDARGGERRRRRGWAPATDGNSRRHQSP